MTAGWPSETLPKTLRDVSEPFYGQPPLDVRVFDAAAYERDIRIRVDPPPPKPLPEADVRKRLRLQDPENWSKAQTLGFSAPTLRRFKPAPSLPWVRSRCDCGRKPTS